MFLYPPISNNHSPSKWIGLWLLISLFSSACDLIHPPVAPLSPHSPQALRKELEELLELAKSPDHTKKLEAKISSYLPKATDVQTLLRDNQFTQQLGSLYESQLRSKAIQELPWTLQELTRLGYTQVEIARVGPQAGSTNAYGDLALLEQLKVRMGLYTVRIRKEGIQDQSLRLSGWLYNERYGWISLLKLGEEIRRRQAL